MAKKLLEWLSAAATLWGFLPSAWTAPVVAMLASATAYFGYNAGGVFYSLVGGSIVIMCALVSAYVLMQGRRTGTVFEQIAVEDVGLSEGVLKAVNPEKKEFIFTHVALNCYLKNHSERTIYLKLKREHHSVGNLVSPHTAVSDQILIIQPRSRQQITFSTLPDIPIGDQITGKLELEVLYGSGKDDLRYLMTYDGQVLMGLHIDTQQKQAQGKINCIIRKLAHEKV